jgi:hypothetical protein
VLTISQASDTDPSNEFQYSLRATVTTADAAIAAGDLTNLQQRIEGYNVRDLIGKTFTISFWVRSSKTGIHCIALGNSVPDRTYVAEYTIIAANTWEKKSIVISGGLVTAGTWNWTAGIGLIAEFAMACGSTYQTTAGAWNVGNFGGTANQVNCLDTIGNIFAITAVQLEVGPVATPFEQIPISLSLQLCQRYFGSVLNYYRRYDDSFTNGTDGGMVHFPVTPRAIPTANLTLAGGNVGTFTLVGTSTAMAYFTYVFTSGGAPVGRDATVSGTYSAEL